MSADQPSAGHLRFTYQRVNRLFIGGLIVLVAAAASSYFAQRRFVDAAQLSAEHQQAIVQLSDRLRESTFVSLVFLGLALVLFCSAFRFYRDEHERRTRAEAVLRTSNEQLKRETERALSADRLKSAFLATMSHELRTPLNSIIGFSAIIEQGLAGPVNDEQKKQLGMVLTSARHLLSLINEILDLSKIEAGQLELEKKPFVLNDAVHHVAELLRPQAEKKGLAFSVEENARVEVVSDRRRLEQVLMNLVGNALKFTEEGSIKINLKEDGPDVGRIEIIDTGIGIQRTELDRLFQPFQQLGSGLSRPKDGTGLGLSICKKLLHLLGGTIEVRSEWGMGSTFSVNLPAQGVVSAATISAPRAPTP